MNHDASDHTHWTELAAGHAIHALEPDEEAGFLAHLDECDSCRQSLDEYRFVAAELGGLSADAEDLPAWEDIRPELPRRPMAVVRPMRATRHRRGSRPARLLAAAAGVTALTAGGVLVDHQITSSPGNSSAITNCRTSNGCRVIQLHAATSTAADLLVQGTQVRMVSVAMAAPASNHVYWLWQLPRDGAPVALMQFRTPPHGQTPTTSLARPYADTAAFAVSLEPSGVVPTHPTEVLATAAAGA